MQYGHFKLDLQSDKDANHELIVQEAEQCRVDMNKLQAMEVFVQVVDAGGFTRAAEAMQLPKATVSTLVQSLEQALDGQAAAPHHAPGQRDGRRRRLL
jgi:hypothetical protein